MSDDMTLDTSDERPTDVGVYRVRVVADQEGTGNPRKEYDNVGVMVAEYPRFDLPYEGDHPGAITDRVRNYDHGFRVVSRWLRMFHGATVVLPIYSGGGGSEVRWHVGPADDDGDGAIGVIYDTPDTRAMGWGDEVPSVETMTAALRHEVTMYDTWANGEMTFYVVERATDEDGEAFEFIDSCCGYYSVGEAMEQGTASMLASILTDQGDLIAVLDGRAGNVEYAAAVAGQAIATA